MNYILSDGTSHENLQPLTFTRPVAELRCGILTIREKWELYLHTQCSYITQAYLTGKYPLMSNEVNVIINAACLPHKQSVDAIQHIDNNTIIIDDAEKVVAACVASDKVHLSFGQLQAELKTVRLNCTCATIDYPWDIFTRNSAEIELDFALLTHGKVSQKLSETNTVICPENVFVEEGAEVECAILQARGGKIYIGKDALVMEGAIIRGPFALCEHATVKMAAKIYEGSTIGPHSKVGGEVQNSVITGYSNKGHDGYLGNAVIGEWCNLGADTNNSNLKNDYSEVRAWNYPSQRFLKTGLQFCGLIMGDHSKSAINTMFNTGTVVGVNANIFGAGFPRNFVPSFSWGGAQGMDVYTLKRALTVAKRVYERRHIKISGEDIAILTYIFQQTEEYRRF
ncbi:MAG: GlmU family protein [Bacteroidales bacterium]|jgi:UDP-N-acetylglucosamine diphosphorylase/glucosamine-1-phosphate N-acetyltransferase|nr:GlmU family protein [Bacteroidales bacterium]